MTGSGCIMQPSINLVKGDVVMNEQESGTVGKTTEGSGAGAGEHTKVETDIDRAQPSTGGAGQPSGTTGGADTETGKTGTEGQPSSGITGSVR